MKIIAALLLCELFVVSARAQSGCPLVSQSEPGSTEGIDYNTMAHFGYCEGPGCPLGRALYVIEGVGHPCNQHEPATVQMSGGATPNNDGIVVSWTVRGNRSNWLYKFGYAAQRCDGTNDLYEQPTLNCVECENFLILECHDTPGEGSRHAECGIEASCTAVCSDQTPEANIVAYDNCDYSSGYFYSHYVDAHAATTSGTSAGAVAYGAAYANGNPFCTGFEVSRCNGSHELSVGSCPCVPAP